MKHYKSLFMVCLFVAGVYLLADKPWKEKPASDWTIEDVRTILNDSPWVKVDSVGVFGDQRGQRDFSRMGGRASGGGRGGGGGGSGVSDSEDNQATRKLYWLQVTWVSDPIRKAYARAGQLAGQGWNETGQNPEILQFYIQGDGLNQLIYPGDQSIKELSYLKTRKHKQVSPLQVVFREPFDREPLAVLAFPASIDGVPTVTAEDKEVEAQIQLGDGRLKVKFKLRDMIVDGVLMIQ
jgi:hypothetical protein